MKTFLIILLLYVSLLAVYVCIIKSYIQWPVIYNIAVIYRNGFVLKAEVTRAAFRLQCNCKMVLCSWHDCMTTASRLYHNVRLIVQLAGRVLLRALKLQCNQNKIYILQSVKG